MPPTAGPRQDDDAFVRRTVKGWVWLIYGPALAVAVLLFAVGVWAPAVALLAMLVPVLPPIVPAAYMLRGWSRLIARSADDPHHPLWTLVSLVVGAAITVGSLAVFGFVELAAAALVLPLPHHSARELVELMGLNGLFLVFVLGSVYGAVGGARAARRAGR